MGSGEKIIEEEAKNASARPHSGIRLSVIDEVDKDSTEQKDEDEINKNNKMKPQLTTRRQTMDNGGSGFSMPSPKNNCEGGIDSVIEGDIC